MGQWLRGALANFGGGHSAFQRSLGDAAIGSDRTVVSWGSQRLAVPVAAQSITWRWGIPERVAVLQRKLRA